MSNVQHIGEILRRVLANRGLEKGAKAGEVLAMWPEIAGKALSERTEAVALEEQILFLKVEDPAWRNELSLMSEQLTEKVNKYFGERRVSRIHLI